MNYSVEMIMLLISLSFIFFIIFINQSKSKSTTGEAPELGGRWSIIGHLHLLGGRDVLLYRTLGAMADRYGSVFKIWLGTRPALVISSWEVAKECFTINDKALISRHKTVAIKHMGYNYAMFGFAPYTPHWREMRKISTLELLSNSRLEMLKDIRASEINSAIKDLYGRCKENYGGSIVVEINEWLEHMSLNIIVMMVAGKRYFGVGGGDEDEAQRCRKAIRDFFALIDVVLVSDAIPFLWWLDLQGYEKRMKKTAKDLDLVLGGWLDEHRQKKKSNKDDAKDFIDVMLSLDEEGKLSNAQYDSDTSIKATAMAMILGATDTTAGTLTWAISLLLNHPNVLKKLHCELDEMIGQDRQVEESDVKNLVYLDVVIKELLRLYPAGPLLGPREAIEDCTIAGFNVKAGTRLIGNVWKLQRDESVWTDPSEFKPERFMSIEHGHVDLRGQQFVLMPFGVGRRSCPGASFGIQVLHLALARIVHAFDLGAHGSLPVDMTERPGLTIPKKMPVEVIFTPRLPKKMPEVYRWT